MGELLDDGLIAVDLLAHRFNRLTQRVDLRQQLRSSARSCSGVSWSRLGKEVMPLIVPEQAISADKAMGPMAGATAL